MLTVFLLGVVSGLALAVIAWTVGDVARRSRPPLGDVYDRASSPAGDGVERLRRSSP